MRDYVELGSAPCDEDCVQVTQEGAYLTRMRAECLRYIDLIRRKLGLEPEGARLAIRSCPHDLGTYLEVVCYYDTLDFVAADYAYRCEREAPRTWDDVSPMPEDKVDVPL